MPFTRAPFDWQLKTRVLPLGRRTLLMGIVNITPDSFSDGGQFLTPRAAVDRAVRLLDEGADVLDLGAESTRPNAVPISAHEEQGRLIPVLRGVLRVRPESIVSVDTYHATTAEIAVAEGAEIVNDVSGLLWDEAMAAVLAHHRPGAVLMHTRGRPGEWATLPPLAQDAVLPLVMDGLKQTIARAAAAGMARETMVLDPGFGFGKIGVANFTLLAGIDQLEGLGFPILAGISRKRFLTAHVDVPTPEQRLEATSAANVAAVLGGAHLLRVHDLPAGRLAASVADRLLHQEQPSSRR